MTAFAFVPNSFMVNDNYKRKLIGIMAWQHWCVTLYKQKNAPT